MLHHAPLIHIVGGMCLSGELEDALLGQTDVLGAVLATCWPARSEERASSAFRYPARRARALLRAGAGLGQRDMPGAEPQRKTLTGL